MLSETQLKKEEKRRKKEEEEKEKRRKEKKKEEEHNTQKAKKKKTKTKPNAFFKWVNTKQFAHFRNRFLTTNNQLRYNDNGENTKLSFCI